MSKEQEREAPTGQEKEKAGPGGEEGYRLAVENARDYAIFTMDPENRITSWSPGAERLLGFTEKEILGEEGDVIFVPEDRAVGAPEQELRRAVDKGRAENERWHLRKDASRFWGSGVVTPIRDRGGELRGFVKVMRDETERRQWEEDLQHANDRLERRVAERTAELERLNESLRQEIAERQRAETARTRLLDQLVRAQELERGRISRELHDQMGQLVAGLLLGLGTVREHAAGSPELQERLEALEGLARNLSGEVRDLALELRPPVLDELGLDAAVANLLEDWSAQSGVAVDLQWSLPGEERLASAIELTIYRVLQESLTNIVRHSGATRAGVIVERRDGLVQVIVEDNGTGFDAECVLGTPSPRRLGLAGMIERVGLVNGTVAVESSPGHGTSIFCRIPVGMTDGGAGS